MEKKLGLSALTALVLSSMLGAGVFSLPQNMAAVASPAALLIGWAITGVGILLLAFAMLILTRIRSELDGGIFTYAREGFGELIGFCSAWGVCTPRRIRKWTIQSRTEAPTIACQVLPSPNRRSAGVSVKKLSAEKTITRYDTLAMTAHSQTAASINLVATLAKLLPLGAFIVLAIMMFKLDTFTLDFTGVELGTPVWEQVKNTMLITLWVFIGVEGAVVVSARAKNKRDVGRATLLAVLAALGIYLLVTLLSLGVLARPELAEMRNPSMAGLMVKMMGPWGEIIIAAGLIVSVCGAYLSWTIMAAEVPFLAAAYKSFPGIFARQNAHGAPSASLWLTNICVQICLVLIWLTGSDYNTLLTIASEMILVPYFLVGAFLLKIATRPLHRAVGIGACLYGLWLLYASGPMHLLLSVVLYAPGLLVFLYARRTHKHDNVLNRQEVVLMGLLLIAAVPATWMLVA
ncbi:amino acid permease [Salmonella enterica]|nr:amino acid permease [Salmonella enterica]